jgi:hypothetical protein
MSMTTDNPALTEGLRAAVPLFILQVRDLPFWERQRLAASSALVVASQGDTLQYGSQGTRFGDGAREMRRHEAHGDAKAEQCSGCPRAEDSAHCCLRRFRDACGVCLRGQPTYSAGEVFNFLARGLAVLACQPGGITWAGLHWCAYRHPCCPSMRSGRRPCCCTCTDACLLVAPCTVPPPGSVCAGGCTFCANGCAAATTAQACCTAASRPEREDEMALRSKRLPVTGDVL